MAQKQGLMPFSPKKLNRSPEALPLMNGGLTSYLLFEFFTPKIW